MINSTTITRILPVRFVVVSGGHAGAGNTDRLASSDAASPSGTHSCLIGVKRVASRPSLPSAPLAGEGID
jgi:hypothetical protein